MVEKPRLIQDIEAKGGRAELVDAFAGADGLEWQIYAVVDNRGRPRIIAMKIAANGFVKKAVQIAPTDAERVAAAIARAREKLREML